jgi:hypothetical protein
MYTRETFNQKQEKRTKFMKTRNIKTIIGSH